MRVRVSVSVSVIVSVCVRVMVTGITVRDILRGSSEVPLFQYRIKLAFRMASQFNYKCFRRAARGRPIA